MMNYRHPFLGKSGELFDFLKPKPQGGSVYDVFKPRATSAPRLPGPGPAKKSKDFYDFFKPAHKRIEESEVPVGGDPFAAAAGMTPGDGDPFAAAAAVRRTAPQGRTFKAPPSGEAWKPYPRMREGYQAPVAMSGSGDRDGTGFLKNPAFWLIAGVTVLIALEANGVTKLNSNA